MSNETSWTSHGIPLGPMEMGTQTFCVLLSVVCFLSVYIFSSVVLLYYPSLLHRKKHLAFILPRHISHRGEFVISLISFDTYHCNSKTIICWV